jgi:hypothetical protein
MRGLQSGEVLLPNGLAKGALSSCSSSFLNGLSSLIGELIKDSSSSDSSTSLTARSFRTVLTPGSAKISLPSLVCEEGADLDEKAASFGLMSFKMLSSLMKEEVEARLYCL